MSEAEGGFGAAGGVLPPAYARFESVFIPQVSFGNDNAGNDNAGDDNAGIWDRREGGRRGGRSSHRRMLHERDDGRMN